MPSSAESFPAASVVATLDGALDAAAAAIVAASPVHATILIDGRSGAGKSSLADRVLARLPGATLLRMDAIYPGWDGLAAATETVLHGVLEPRALGRAGAYPGWDWSLSRLTAAVAVPAGGTLIIEGCGAVTAASAALADVTVWADAPVALRRERALERDGDGYRPFWDMWAAQEDTHIVQHDPRALATFVLDLP